MDFGKAGRTAKTVARTAIKSAVRGIRKGSRRGNLAYNLKYWSKVGNATKSPATRKYLKKYTQHVAIKTGIGVGAIGAIHGAQKYGQYRDKKKAEKARAEREARFQSRPGSVSFAKGRK